MIFINHFGIENKLCYCIIGLDFSIFVIIDNGIGIIDTGDSLENENTYNDCHDNFIEECLSEDWFHELDSESEERDDFVQDTLERNIRYEIRNWALDHNINHQAVGSLLKLLNHFMPSADLPRDPRTLLNTPRAMDFPKFFICIH